MTWILAEFVSKRVYLFAGVVFALLLLLVTAWIYSPGAAGPALLDDYSNIAIIPELAGKPEFALDYVLGSGSGPLGRPVSMASFVLESLFFERNIETSKQINIGLHLLNGCLVIWLFTLLFRHLQVPGALGLVILLGAAWMLSPVFVSTVLYVVQRMAMLAATFMLLALIFYCHWRASLLAGRFRLDLLLALGLAFALAIYSKENAIVLVPLLLLLEALWFEFKGSDGCVSGSAKAITLAVMTMGALAVCFLLLFGKEWYAGAYAHRHFTEYERVLTETRILWDYLRQLCFPDLARMGILHDDWDVSKSLFEPITTLYSTLAWMFVALACLILLRWRYGRCMVFAVSFFVVGHGAESTVIPLELYFEHRNYFPAVGLFLGVGVLYASLVSRWPQVKSPLLAYLGVYSLLLATQTSSQVQVWSNPTLLILNNLNGHPGSFRANTDMAMLMANLGDIEAASRYSAQAFAVSRTERSGDYIVRDLALSCIANEPVNSAQFQQLGSENSARPLSSVTTLISLVRMLQDNACPEFDRIAFADKMADIFLEKGHPDKAASNIYSSLAILENSLERYGIAYDYNEKSLTLAPDNTRGLLMKLHFTTALGNRQEAELVIQQLQKMSDEGKLSRSEQQTLALYVER